MDIYIFIKWCNSIEREGMTGAFSRILRAFELEKGNSWEITCKIHDDLWPHMTTSGLT